MSLAVPTFDGPAASGGADWLFADPFAYQYFDIPEHVQGIRSRSQSPAISTAGSAASELEGTTLPVLYELSSGADNGDERFELEGCVPTPPPPPMVAQARLCATAPPSPEERNAAGLGPTNYVPTSLLPGHGRQQPPQVQQQPPQPHVLNTVNRNNSEIVRSRHANVRLSRKYPSNPSLAQHRRGMTMPAPVPVSDSGMRSEGLITRAGPPFTGGAGPMPTIPVGRPQVPQQQPHYTRKLMPIRTDVIYETGLIPVEEHSSSTTTKMPSSKDFDSILRDFDPSTVKKSAWRQSRSSAYLEKYGTWGA